MVSIQFSWLYPYGQHFFFFFYFPPQLTGAFWSFTLKDICSVFQNTFYTVAGYAAILLDTERVTTHDLIGQNMIVKGYDPHDQSNHCSTFAPVM